MIAFQYSYPKFKIKNANKIKAWLLQVIKGEKKKLAVINYVFINDEEILIINRQSLDHDYYTDIITFPLKYDPIESDIYISIDRIKDHAQEYKVTFPNELHRVMVHGLLHMCGYKDKKKADKLKMTAREDYWLAKLK